MDLKAATLDAWLDVFGVIFAVFDAHGCGAEGVAGMCGRPDGGAGRARLICSNACESSRQKLRIHQFSEDIQRESAETFVRLYVDSRPQGITYITDNFMASAEDLQAIV